MFLYSNIIGACFLGTEGVLAWIAFGSLTNPCVKPPNWDNNKIFIATFPC